MDTIDRTLLGLLIEDADQTYAELGKAVHLSAPATHERIRKMRASGIIRKTTIEVDPTALGKSVLAFVLVKSGVWCGDQPTTDALLAISGIEAAYAITGNACVLAKVRVATPDALQAVLREIYAVEGAQGTESIIVLSTFFERSMSLDLPQQTTTD